METLAHQGQRGGQAANAATGDDHGQVGRGCSHLGPFNSRPTRVYPDINRTHIISTLTNSVMIDWFTAISVITPTPDLPT
jgi:hypothetical protein